MQASSFLLLLLHPRRRKRLNSAAARSHPIVQITNVVLQIAFHCSWHWLPSNYTVYQANRAIPWTASHATIVWMLFDDSLNVRSAKPAAILHASESMSSSLICESTLRIYPRRLARAFPCSPRMHSLRREQCGLEKADWTVLPSGVRNSKTKL